MDVLQSIGQIAGYVVFYLFMFAGVCLIPLGLPGQFLIVFTAFVFILIAGSEVLAWWVLVVLLVMAVLAEVFEAAAGSLGAGTAKGSLWSCFGALGGGILGAVLGSIVFPIIGSVIGVLAGTFLGAYVVEYYRTNAASGSAQVAKGALIGRVVGSMIKVLVGLAMILLVSLYWIMQ